MCEEGATISRAYSENKLVQDSVGNLLCYEQVCEVLYYRSLGSPLPKTDERRNRGVRVWSIIAER